MLLCNLLGNEMAKAALQRMVDQKRVPNTLLFSGPDGVGKSRFALGLASALMGPHHHDKIASGNHPDLHVYFPEGKGAMHPIDSMHELIEEVGLPPFAASVKVFIIHDAHQMLPTSSNALLKTLEEPNWDSYIILLTDRPELVLSTIVSRCRCLPFFPVATPLISSYLMEYHRKSAAEAERIALLSHGSFSKALQLAAQSVDRKRQLLIELLTCDKKRQYIRFLALCGELEEALHSSSEAEEQAGAIQEEAEWLFAEIFGWYRDLYLMRQGLSTPSSLYHREYEDTLKQHSACSPLPNLEEIFSRIQTCELALQRHVKLRVILEHLLFP